MHSAEHFLRNLAMVMSVAALTTWLFQSIRQPVVLGYIIAGLIIGPHVATPLVADEETVHTLSEMGVVLLMFGIGLEFSLRKLVRVGPTAGLVAVLQVAIMIWLGYSCARLFGWGGRASLFAGAAIAISSTTIIAKAFEARPIAPRLREIVLGVLIVEDLIAILLLATLTTVAAGRGLTAGALALTSARLFAFLAGLVIVGLLVVPRFIRAVVALKRPETTLVASIGVCFVTSLVALSFGYSVALGAFLAGVVVAESGCGAEIEHLVAPVRDMFAAIFFVAVGMQIEPQLVLHNWLPIVVLTAVVVVGKFAGVGLGVFLTGNGVRTAVQAGMSLAQIGEFSFIIAALAVSTRVAGSSLYVIAVAVSALTTLLTPFLIATSGGVAAWIDRKLPPRLQTFASLYASWVDGLRSQPGELPARSRRARLMRLLAVDVACLVGTIVATSLWLREVTRMIARTTGIAPATARDLVVAAASLLAAPLALGIVRLSRSLGSQLALDALPASPPGRTDLAAAPRRVLVLALQLGCMLLVGAVVIALTQPFMPLYYGATILAGALVVAAFTFWRSAGNLHGHVRAGAEIIAEALGRDAPGATGSEMATARDVLEGLGTPTPLAIRHGSPAIGRSLRQLDLRGVTGATVLAIRRRDGALVLPGPDDVLAEGDILAVSGSVEALQSAHQLLSPLRPTG
jgi:CPA2 family monovalent cation:H+ antiporter-2